MADTQSRLAEIYKAEKSKGGGIASTLGKRTLEKIDPRQFFNQKGFMAAALPSLFKSYSATPAKSGEKVSSLGSGSFSSGALENKLDVLVGETRDVKINSKISAKNSMSLPDMARDMNVMRQNITTLVKQQGGETTNKADMYFKKSSENEAAYENRFIKERGVKTTPTQVGAKPEEKKGIFATIMEGLSSIFSMKGALIAGILAVLTLGIKEYFSNDEFKGKVDALVSDMFSTIKGFLIEYWKEVAIGLALLFPSATMTLISSGISILSNGITLLSKAATTLAPLFAEGLTFAVRSLITLLSGPAGLIILLGGALFAARKLFDQNQEEYLKLAKEKKEKGSLSEKDEARLKELNSPTNEAAAEKQLGYNPITGKVVTQQEANRSMDQRQKDNAVPDRQLKDTAALQLRDEYEAGGKKDSKLDPNNNENIERRFQELKKAQSAPNESGAEAARLAGSGTKPTPVPFSSAADSQAANMPAIPIAPTSAPASTTSPTKSSTTPITTGSGGAAFGMYPKPGGIQSDLMAAFAQEGITDEKTQIALLANIKKESGFKPISENLNYTSTARLKEVFPTRTKNLSDEQLKQYTNNPQGLAEFVYGGKMGNTEPGDGFKYRGRGFIQLTGKNNYASMGAALNLPLVDNPDLANDPIVAARIAARYIKDAKLRKSFDTQEEANRAVTQAIGGSNLNLNSGYGASLLGKVNSYAGDISLASSEGTSSPNQSAALAPNAPSSTGLNMPSVGTLAAAAPSMGNMIEAATSAFGDVARVFDTAMASVTNVTNNNTQSSSAGQQSQGNLPSVYDDVFLNLFQRVT